MLQSADDELTPIFFSTQMISNDFDQNLIWPVPAHLGLRNQGKC